MRISYMSVETRLPVIWTSPFHAHLHVACIEVLTGPN